jgi:hypothetical protein
LSEVFKNSALLSICQKVLLTGYPQSFYFISEHFGEISQDLFDSMNDFRIILSNGEIRCNHIFFFI